MKLILLYDSVLLLAVCNSSFHWHLGPLQGKKFASVTEHFQCHWLSYCLLKKEIVRSRSDLNESFWTKTISRGESQNCQDFDFPIPEEMLICLAAWSTGSRNETLLARPLVSIIMGGICIYIVNAQTFLTSWSMKSPFRWRKKYNPAFLGDVAVPSKASVAQINV